MRLEDALLYLVLGPEDDGRMSLRALCSEAIAGGVDVVQFQTGIERGALADAVAVCREEEALAIVAEDAALVVEVEAAGVHLASPEASVGRACAMMGGEGIVGVSSRTFEDVQLAAEVGADYVLHYADGGCPVAAFGGCRELAGLPLYAAGVRSAEEARTLVEQGIYRICVPADNVDSADIAEHFMEY